MSTKLIEYIGQIKGQSYGILETPMYPNSYYGGPIMCTGMEWIMLDNATSNYFKTDTEAYVKTVERIERISR